jgi:PAS domain S-box-containing protein
MTSLDDRRIIDVNDAYVELVGYSREELIGHTAEDLDLYASPSDRARMIEIPRADGSLPDFATILRTKSAELRHVTMSSSIIAMEGKPHLLATVVDVTERRLAEAALRESESRLNEAQHNARIGSWCYRFGGSLTMSDEMYDLYGLPRDVPATYEMVIAAVHPDDRARNHNHFQHALESGALDFHDEYRLIRPDGQVRNIFALGKIRRGADGALIEAVGTVQDVTERKQAEEALQATEERLRLFIEHAPASLAMFDREMRYLSVSHRWLSDFGLGERDLRGLSHYEVFPEIAESWKAIHRRALAGEVVRNDSDRFDRLDGSGQWLRWEVRPWHDTAGLVGGIVVFSEDITERKQAEEEILRLHEELLRHAADLEQHVLDRTAQLEAANKELEAFSYSVSHDLRAPLRAINGFARMLTEDHGPALDAEGQRLLGVIRGEASRMGRLIDELLQFSRLGRQPLHESSSDMTAMARSVYDELRAGAPERIVDFRLDSLPSVPADPALLRQVWINLLDNALKFTRHREHAGIVVSGSVNEGEAIYSVRDNGAGFDMKYASKLFGVFQRLHGLEEFEGTGVGLALVQRIVNRHGGRVWAEATLGRGATFSFSLPLPEASPEGTFASEPSGAEPTNVVQRN